jgi:hypothetical protein
MDLTKRGLLALGASSLLLAAGGGGAASAQEEGGGGNRQVPRRRAVTKILFKAPSGFPNALAVTAEGLWLAEQKPRGGAATRYNLNIAPDATENVWLINKSGKVLKTVATPGRNTSGLAVGGGYIWSCALTSGADDGIYQIDMNGKLISHRQVPLGAASDGGGIHGAFWQDGRLWIFANRLNAIMRINPDSWTTEFILPVSNRSPRYHGIAWDNGSIWAITGNATSGYKDAKFGLEKYDAATGRLLEIVDFDPGSADPHGLTMLDGKLISCDAGIHPGWPVSDSPTWGNIFEIDVTDA